MRLLEALIVGFATRRGHSPLITGSLYCLVNAVLLAVAPDIYGVGQSTWALAMQQLLNKMVPVVIANLLASIVSDGIVRVPPVCGRGAYAAMRFTRSCSSRFYRW